MSFKFQGFDFLQLDAGLSDEETLIRRTARDFVEDRVVPIIEGCFREARFPRELVPLLGQLGFYGANLRGYGCAGLSNVEYGLVMQELERGDSGVRSFVSVQSALVMYPIFTFGSEDQKNAWLPALAKGEKIGCFGLTEPGFGSNPAGMTTRARQSGNGYILNGEKMWITSGSIADVAVIWAKLEDGAARDAEDADSIRGFLVETNRPGFTVREIHDKWSLRASVTSGLTLQDVHVPAANLLPGAKGLKSPLLCLTRPATESAGASSARPWIAIIRHSNTPKSGNSSTVSSSQVTSSCRKSWCGWRARSQRRS
jgi:glutaryl-CoA dehydrogenase